MEKISSKLGIEGNLNVEKKKAFTRNLPVVLLNGERLNAFSLRLGTRQGCSLSFILFSIVLKTLTAERV